MSVTDEKLMAFADGELNPIERAEIEQALARDPGLRQKLVAHEAMRGRFSQSFDATLGEPVPDRLTAAAQGKARAAEIVDLAQHRAAKWSYREWGAMAASLVGGLALGLGAMSGQGPMIAVTDDGLSARGALLSALEQRLSADAGGAARIGLSFQNRDGEFCRTFNLSRQEVAGLACRTETDWRVAMTTARQAGGGEVRTAGTDTPPEILAAVESMIAGDVLDAEAEARARDRGWRIP